MTENPCNLMKSLSYFSIDVKRHDQGNLWKKVFNEDFLTASKGEVMATMAGSMVAGRQDHGVVAESLHLIHR